MAVTCGTPPSDTCHADVEGLMGLQTDFSRPFPKVCSDPQNVSGDRTLTNGTFLCPNIVFSSFYANAWVVEFDNKKQR